jgi:hypothetical protein
MLDDMLLSSVQQSIISYKRSSIDRKGSFGLRNSLLSKAKELEHKNTFKISPVVTAPKKESWPDYEAPKYFN